MNSTLQTKPTTLSKFFKATFFLVAVMAFGINNNASAQTCTGPYQWHEGVTNAPAGYMTTAGWSLVNGTAFSVVAGNGYSSATSSLGMVAGAATNGAVISPVIANASTFNFWIKRVAGVGSSYTVSFSDNNGANYYPITAGTNISHSGSLATPFNITSTTPVLGTAYAQVTISGAFPFSAQGYKFKVAGTLAVAGAIYMDDFTWSSTAATDNRIVVPNLGSTTCSPILVPATGIMSFYDNGGVNDNYSISQANTVVFQPTNVGDKVKVTIMTYAGQAVATTDYLTIYNGNLGTQLYSNITTGTAVLGTNYTSSDSAGLITVRFNTNAATNAAGFYIKVECVACPANNDMTADSPTATTVDINYGASASSYDVNVYTDGTVPNSGTAAQTVDTSGGSFTLSGLTSNTTYHAWIRASCGSAWYGPIDFTTLCAAVNVPYTENFNGLPSTALPTCTSADSGTWQVNNTNGNLYSNGVGTMFFSKAVNLSTGVTYRLSYDYATLTGNATFSVYRGQTIYTPDAVTIGTAGNLLITHTINSTLTTNMINFTVPSSGVYYLGFKLTAVDTQFNIDNIVLEVETCFPPTGLTSPGVPTVSSANLSWIASASAPANGYQYYLSTSTAAPNFGTPATGTTAAGVTTAIATGLSSNTTYYFWVRSNCAGHISAWSLLSGTFHTDTIPTAVNVNINGAGSPATGCYFNFFDSAGPTSNYGDNESYYKYTFRAGAVGQQLRAVFSEFSTEATWDGMMIYDAPDDTNPATLISSGAAVGNNATTCPAGAFSGTNSPGTIYSTSGYLTFVFRSDYIITRPGWAASLSCVTRPTVTSFTPTANNCLPGTAITITGTNFTTVPITNVKIGGVSATFTVVNNTTINATLPAGAVTGPISVSNIDATGISSGVFTVTAPPPTTTGVAICPGGTGSISSSTSCQGYENAGNTLAGAWSPADLTANRPGIISNSTACTFSTSVRNYTAVQFQVSITGSYTFVMTDNGVDAMSYITTGAFVPGNCTAGGAWVIGDDDSGPGLEPQMVVTLTAGITYTLYSTTYGVTGTYFGSYNWNISSVTGGQIMLYQNSQIQWYTAAVGGSSIYSGATFNPVGVAGSGLANTNTAGSFVYYAACSSNSTCRTATTFLINPKPVITITDSGAATCATPNSIITLTASSPTATNFTWASTVANSLYSDAAATTLYIAGTNATIVYLKTSTNATVTVTGTITATGCTNTQTINITISATTWSGGAWDNGVPNATTSAVILDDYTSTGNLTACSLVIDGGDVEFFPGHTLTLQNNLNVISGGITFYDDASLVQVNNVTNTGNITYKRDTTPVFKYDYTYWSSPVAPQTLVGLSPFTMSDKYFAYNPTIDNWVYVAGNTLMNPGKGYIIRTPDIAPFNTATTNVFHGSFYGIPNNGTITTPIIGGTNQLNLVGNPYPSAISADAFLSDAGNDPLINGTIYLWTHNTPITANQYTGSDYAVYNYLGGIGTSAASNPGVNTNVPNGKIASGQGFFVEGAASGTASFKNSMRLVGNNDQFFRATSTAAHTDAEPERHRLWLDISNPTGAYKQVLIGYAQNATNGLDRKFDSNMIDIGNAVTFYSFMDDKKLSIQGKGLPFDVNDQIPLGYRSTDAAGYAINLSDFDGLFETQAIYLEDKLLNVIHNLKDSPYAFVTEAGTFDSRFVLRYMDTALGTVTHNFDEQSVVVYKNNQVLIVQTAGTTLNTVTIYDVRGRLIASQKGINLAEARFNSLPETHQVLLVKITSTDGATVTKKVVY